MVTIAQRSRTPKPISVLHVDDDPDQLRFTKTFLERDPQIKVTTVGSSMEVLKLLEESKFDIIITDYKMPLMNGLQLAKKVRENFDTPIIIYTSQGSEEVADRAFQVGVDDYVRKDLHPAHYQVLIQQIKNIVEKHRAEDALRRSEEQYRTLLARTQCKRDLFRFITRVWRYEG